MMRVFVGDAALRAAKRRALNASFQELDAAALTPEELAGMAGTSSLMGEKQSYLVSGLFTRDDADAFIELAEGLADSEHLFVFEEEKLGVAVVRELEKGGAKVETLKSLEKKEPFNVFAMANALSSGDKKKLWLLLVRALRQGISPENIAGVLHWKARTACAAARGPDRVRWEKLSRELVVMYHDSHRGAGDLELLLERFALKL